MPNFSCISGLFESLNSKIISLNLLSRSKKIFWFPRKDFQFWLAERNSRIGKKIDQYLVNIYLTSKLSLWFPWSYISLVKIAVSWYQTCFVHRECRDGEFTRQYRQYVVFSVSTSDAHLRQRFQKTLHTWKPLVNQVRLKAWVIFLTPYLCHQPRWTGLNSHKLEHELVVPARQL
jgi:hypothetical protein